MSAGTKASASAWPTRFARRGQYHCSFFAQAGDGGSADASRGAGHKGASALQFSWL
jgi:hypothetical protein